MIYSGVLRTDSAPAGYDWVYPVTKDKPMSIKRLQSRFVWLGEPSDKDEHGVVAFVQGGQPGTSNGEGEQLWKTGVGAFVMNNTGIGIELWDMPEGAVWWTQNQPTASGVTLPVVSLEQGIHNPPPNGFITRNEGFTLRKNELYWLRLTLTRKTGGYVGVFVELFEQTTLIQLAQMNVLEDHWLPEPATVLGAVARALGTSDIQIDAFDYF